MRLTEKGWLWLFILVTLIGLFVGAATGAWGDPCQGKTGADLDTCQDLYYP